MAGDLPFGPHLLGSLIAPLASARAEMAAIAYLAADGRVLGLRHVAGAVDRLVLPIRSVAIDALGFDAHAVVMAHNHPSGDPTPSEADLAVTRRVSRGLEAIGIRLLDHLVVAGDRRVSLRSAGYL